MVSTCWFWPLGILTTPGNPSALGESKVFVPLKHPHCSYPMKHLDGHWSHASSFAINHNYQATDDGEAIVGSGWKSLSCWYHCEWYMVSPYPAQWTLMLPLSSSLICPNTGDKGGLTIKAGPFLTTINHYLTRAIIKHSQPLSWSITVSHNSGINHSWPKSNLQLTSSDNHCHYNSLYLQPSNA